TITDTDTKTVTDTDIKTITDTDTKTVSDSNNTSDSFNKTDTDFAVIEDVKDVDNLGVAGHDLTFNRCDDFSFTLDVDSILNNSLSGAG
ncbi:fibrinogen-binding protein, partial [Rhizobium ruizarguesonis]